MFSSFKPAAFFDSTQSAAAHKRKLITQSPPSALLNLGDSSRRANRTPPLDESGQIIQLSERQQRAHFKPMIQPATPLLSESSQTRVLKIICLLVCVLSVSCVRAGDGSPSVLSVTNAPPQMTSPESAKQLKGKEADRAFDDYVAKQREDRIRGIPPPPSQFPFPNVYGEPLHPRPNYVNFYRINDHYPDYLLCEYKVDVKNYSQSKEAKWFKTALKQIRHSGPTKFPPIKWIAVIICNEAEWKDANTMDQAFKVGAIFKASDVFDSSSDLSQLITQANMDRHPFFLDRKRPDLFPAEQQRWMIVERHATNNPTTGSN
jgi:hypothetical protein